jgi:hypothetical protein
VQRGRRVNRSKTADLPGPVLERHGAVEAFNSDGFFKELVRSGEAIPRMFDLPKIADGRRGEPAARRHDRFTCLQNGSLLNIEHLSSTGEFRDLARRMARRPLQSAENPRRCCAK